MKKYGILIIIAGLLFFPEMLTGLAAKKPTDKVSVDVYYFHATRRCYSCSRVEANTKQAVENNFKKEMESGIVNFVPINVDQPENKPLVTKYQVFGSSVFVVKKVNGTEVANENISALAFRNANNPEAFEKLIKDKVLENLK